RSTVSRCPRVPCSACTLSPCPSSGCPLSRCPWQDWARSRSACSSWPGPGRRRRSSALPPPSSATASSPPAPSAHKEVNDMEIDLPEVVAEVRAAFDRYEKALNANDVDVLDASFWNDPRTIRYSLTDNGYGFTAIHASRLARPRTDMTRTIMHTVITTFGRDLATAN